MITKSLLEDEKKLENKKQQITLEHNKELNKVIDEYDLKIVNFNKRLESTVTNISNINKLYQYDIQEKSRLEAIQNNYSKIVIEINDINELLERKVQR